MFQNGHNPTLTTSWDDGHPFDLRIAELLAKHGLPGTFYVPLQNSRPTLSVAQIRELSSGFEIGAHTVHHRILTALSDEQARAEIYESKARIEQITGKPCRAFCFPSGRFSSTHCRMLAQAGFSAARTVELLSLEPPRLRDGLTLIPTTVQAYPHSSATYLRNAIKRRRYKSLAHSLRYLRARSWESVAAALLSRAVETGGVFHLWGHSWEIDQTQQWQPLQRVLTAMSAARSSARGATNSELAANGR